MLYTFGGKAPQVDPTAFVSASAELIGDVIVGPRCYIGPYAVIRADASRIVLEEEVAVEDGVIIHTGGEDPVVTISRRVTIGHGAIVHARVIGPEASIGMGAVLSLCSEIGAGSIVAGSALVPQGKTIPPETLVAGVPARPLRPPVPRGARPTLAPSVALPSFRGRLLPPAPRSKRARWGFEEKGRQK